MAKQDTNYENGEGNCPSCHKADLIPYTLFSDSKGTSVSGARCPNKKCKFDSENNIKGADNGDSGDGLHGSKGESVAGNKIHPPGYDENGVGLESVEPESDPEPTDGHNGGNDRGKIPSVIAEKPATTKGAKKQQ